MISGGGANRLCPPALAWGYTAGQPGHWSKQEPILAAPIPEASVWRRLP